MRMIRTTTLALGLVTMMSAAGFATPALAAVPNAPYTRALHTTRVHATTGTVTFAGNNRLVITRSGRAMTFMLRPSTERFGHVRVGSVVDVRYRNESDGRVATAVTVEHGRR